MERNNSFHLRGAVCKMNQKILRSNNYKLSGLISIYKFNFISESLSLLDIDCLLILMHFHINKYEKFNCVDVAEFRGLKKISQSNGWKDSGYKKELKQKIENSISKLDALGLIKIIKVDPYSYIFEDISLNKADKIKIPRTLLNFDPCRQAWHKYIGLFLCIYRSDLSDCIIQVDKLLKTININYSFLAPNEIRSRFEDVMDDLSAQKIITGWHYKEIDEDELYCKRWINKWRYLSVKIYRESKDVMNVMEWD